MTTEEIRMLAKMERDMDAGLVPFVRLGGDRISLTPDIQAELGLETGQTINRAIFLAILEASIRHCHREIALQKRPN